MELGAQLDSQNGQAMWKAPSVLTLVRERSGGRGWDPAAVVFAVLGVVIIAVFGLVISFDTVEAQFRPSLQGRAWMVPIGVDLAILVFQVADLLMARKNMRTVWLRWIPLSLIGTTVYLNVAEQTELWSVVGHAVMPVLWAVGVELGTHVVKVRAGLVSEKRMETIRKSRWLLAPVATAMLKRRMILWEVRSYGTALERERDRILAKVELLERYGWLWRFKPSARRARAMYKLFELAPEAIDVAVMPAVDPAPPSPALADGSEAAPSRDLDEAPAEPSEDSAEPADTCISDEPKTLPDLFRRAYAEVAQEVQASGRVVTRDRLAAKVRSYGQTVSNGYASQMLEQLRREAQGQRDED